MSQLRLHLKEEEYLEVVRRLQRSGYRVAFADEEGEVRCVAWFRVTEFLAYGRFLYVDHLMTVEDVRSEGHGRRMLNWLVGVAREEGCKSLHLDPGVQRHEAHGFYTREKMNIFAYHFARAV
jgi:GNAT superfamily N-acetyltransferase